MNTYERVVLIGFSGSGKSTVSRLLADRLGWSVLDMDETLARQWNKTIPEIFQQHGESAFRESERALLLDALRRRSIVISSGGGAVADDAVWADDLLGRLDTLVVALDANPATMLDRLQREAVKDGAAVERPMLSGSDPLARIRQLKDSRQAAYDRADITIVSENTSAAEVADEIAALAALHRTPLTLNLEAPSGCSSIVVGPSAIRELGERLRQAWPKSRRAWIITDHNVGPLHLRSAQAALEASGMTFDSYSRRTW